MSAVDVKDKKSQSKIMVASTAAVLGTLMALDIVWVMLTKNTVYKGLIVQGGRYDKHGPGKVAMIWGLILLTEALMIGYLISKEDGYWQAAVTSAFLGFLVYLVFNGTSIVTNSNWNFKVGGIDLAWGVVLFTIAGLVGYAVRHAMEKKVAKKKLQNEK